jgi:TM2 domain-containing membrane protein YozV
MPKENASMSTARPSIQVTPPESGPLAAVLSFLVPGLGQVLQGRIGKGLLFFFSVYGLFFYGMYLGSGSITLNGRHYQVTGNVFLPDTAAKNNPWGLPTLMANLYNRPQYIGQFWVGVVAWPALYHYNFSAKADENQAENGDAKAETVWTQIQAYQKTPSEKALNAINTSGGKFLELGWVYTVIAGVLNVMVIYDAYAGPAFPGRKEEGV